MTYCSYRCPSTGPATGTATASQRYYAADGSLVATIDGTGTTFTIGNTTAFCTSAGAVSATRTDSFAGRAVAQRTSKPDVAATAVSFITGDSVNTAQIMTGPTTGSGTVDITAVKRHTDPNSLTRGPTTTAVGQTALTTAPAAHHAFIERRRQTRPDQELRSATEAERAEFEQHFLLRRVALGTCHRPYATPCVREHACIKCRFLQVDPA